MSELVDLDARPKPQRRRVAKQDPTGHTYAWLRTRGYVPVRVEYYNAAAGRNQDFMGIIDVIALSKDETLGVQICGADYSSHVKKMTETCLNATKTWLANPNRKLLLIGWRYLKNRGISPRAAWIEIREDGCPSVTALTF